MFAKTVIICTFVVAAAAITPGYLDGALALGAQSEHTVRGFGGLSSVSKQAKAIDSPYSSVRKSDIRVTSDAAYAHPAAVHYAAHPQAYHHPYAAAAPLVRAAHPGALLHHPQAYASPIAHHHPHTYAAAAPIAHHHPLAGPAIARGAVIPGGLGVAYSPATAVATHTFSGYGIHYSGF